MKQAKTFEAFGFKWATTQFSAVDASTILSRCEDMHPTEILRHTEAFRDGEWHKLDTPAAVNLMVRDVTGHLTPKLALDGLCTLVSAYTFGFLKDWRGVTVPTRFRSDSVNVSSEMTDPLISQLIQEGAATLRELEEYYSLEDAFKMFDIIMVKGVNGALAHEAADKAVARAKAKR